MVLIRRVFLSVLAVGAFAMAVEQYRSTHAAGNSALFGLIGIVLVIAAIAGKG
jgi:hypothetical protein